MAPPGEIQDVRELKENVGRTSTLRYLLSLSEDYRFDRFVQRAVRKRIQLGLDDIAFHAAGT